MATIVNLDLGGDGDGEGEGQVYTADLILTSPYVEPEGNLLVLRSRPDIEPVTGTLATVERRDALVGSGEYRAPITPVVGTLAVTGRPDTAAFAGDRFQRVTGTLEATTRDDTIVASGDGYIGLGVRRGTIAAVEQPDAADFAGLWTMKWRATLEATEQPDAAQGTGGFVPYQGPGLIIVTSRPDTANFIGANVYDVTGTLVASEVPDVADFTVITNTQIEVSSSDTLIISEFLVGDTIGDNLVDRLYITDELDYSRDIAFTDNLSVSDDLSSASRITGLSVDTVTLRDDLAVLYQVASTDALIISEALSGDIPFVVYDEIRVNDLLSSHSRITGLLTDNISVVEDLTVLYSAIVADEVVVTDTLDDDLQFTVHSTDRIVISDLLQATMAVTGILADVVIVTDEVASYVVAESADVVIVTETLASSIGQAALLSDTLSVTDVLVGELTVYAPLLTDVVIWADVLTSTTDLQLAGVLSDVVLVGDTLFEAAQTVYIINAETGAVSTYVFTPTISGMTNYQGVLYLAGPEGLYALDATEDDDGAVVWTLRTGFSDLGTDRLKRIRDVNIQARTEGDTTLQVVGARGGQKQEWNYRLPATTREGYRDGVTKVGGGITSVYYELGLQGIGPAEIDQLRIVVEPLSRRR